MARSRQVAKLANSSPASCRDNATGSRRDSRSRSAERDLGRRATWASSPLRSPAAALLASRPFGTGLTAAGSRMARNANMPEIAASRWFTVVAAYWSGHPGSRVCGRSD